VVGRNVANHPNFPSQEFQSEVESGKSVQETRQEWQDPSREMPDSLMAGFKRLLKGRKQG
jgi:hypothetical protein